MLHNQMNGLEKETSGQSSPLLYILFPMTSQKETGKETLQWLQTLVLIKESDASDAAHPVRCLGILKLTFGKLEDEPGGCVNRQRMSQKLA